MLLVKRPTKNKEGKSISELVLYKGQAECTEPDHIAFEKMVNKPV
jgi:hypothetical protein